MHKKSKVADLYLGAGNNGALQLIIEAYVDSILRDLQNDGGTSSKLSKSDISVIRNRMRGLHQHLISHPAINERRLWIGPTQPQFDPYFYNNLQETNPEEDMDNDMEMSTAKKMENKRNHNEYLAEEICATNRKWGLINRTKDINGETVDVVQTNNFKQYIFHYDCAFESRPCSGISKDYNSKCEMRTGWVNMLHTKPGNSAEAGLRRWGYVETPHHCACKITRKSNRSTNCSD